MRNPLFADIGVAIVTVEEALRGRLAALARARDGVSRITQYTHLLEAVRLFSQLTLVPFDQASKDQFQQLFALGLRVGTQDLKIAAVALAIAVVSAGIGGVAATAVELGTHSAGGNGHGILPGAAPSVPAANMPAFNR